MQAVENSLENDLTFATKSPHYIQRVGFVFEIITNCDGSDLTTHNSIHGRNFGIHALDTLKVSFLIDEIWLAQRPQMGRSTSWIRFISKIAVSNSFLTIQWIYRYFSNVDPFWSVSFLNRWSLSYTIKFVIEAVKCLWIDYWAPKPSSIYHLMFYYS